MTGSRARDRSRRSTETMSQLDTMLPFFAYGFLKPGEIAYPRIAEFVESCESAHVNGRFWVRDGLLLLELDAKASLAGGFVLRFSPDRSQRAYKAIADFEPGNMYDWEKATVLINGVETPTNTLVGHNVYLGGSERFTGREWRSRDDPLFKEALEAIEPVAKQPLSGNNEDYGEFFHKYMAYLLLWSSIERYVSLRYRMDGRDLTKRVERLAEEPSFKTALKEEVSEGSKIYRADRPGRYALRLDPADPEGSVRYYYGVRGNMVHRGKAAIQDRKIVDESLRQLLAIYKRVLDVTLGIDQAKSL